MLASLMLLLYYVVPLKWLKTVPVVAAAVEVVKEVIVLDVGTMCVVDDVFTVAEGLYCELLGNFRKQTERARTSLLATSI